MKVIVIGATGTIGQAVVKKLSARHEVIKVGHKGGEYHVDIGSAESIKKLYETIGTVDAIVSTAGLAAFRTLEQLTDDDFLLSVSNKLMGQVNLIRIGVPYTRPEA
ncbi:MAG: NAD-dependent epimerase/dehydratase family protein [Nitrospiraceae bacterium]